MELPDAPKNYFNLRNCLTEETENEKVTRSVGYECDGSPSIHWPNNKRQTFQWTRLMATTGRYPNRSPDL